MTIIKRISARKSATDGGRCESCIYDIDCGCKCPSDKICVEDGKLYRFIKYNNGGKREGQAKISS